MRRLHGVLLLLGITGLLMAGFFLAKKTDGLGCAAGSESAQANCP